MMYDVYVIVANKSKEVTDRFLGNWLSDFQETADEYEYPQYEDNSKILFKDAKKLISYLLNMPGSSYSLYWNNKNLKGEVANGMLFFNQDGSLILGISVIVEDSLKLKIYLEELGKEFGADYGFVNVENPPPESLKEFISELKDSNFIKLIKGKIENS